MSNTVENPTAYAALNLLGQTPRTDIDPKIWAELQRVRRALGEMAGLMDLVNTPPFTTFESREYSVFLQDQTTVELPVANIAQNYIYPYSCVRFVHHNGQIRVRAAYDFEYNVYPIDAFWPYPYELNPGDTGVFVLKGLVGYGRTIDNDKPARGDLYVGPYGYLHANGSSYDKGHNFAGIQLQVLSNGASLVYFNPNRTMRKFNYGS